MTFDSCSHVTQPTENALIFDGNDHVTLPNNQEFGYTALDCRRLVKVNNNSTDYKQYGVAELIT